MWNAIEFDLQELIVRAASWAPQIGFLVTADMGNVARYQLAKNIINQAYNHPRLMNEALNAIAFFDACRVRRNALVHGMPVVDENQLLTGRLAKFEAKKGSGELRISHLNVTDEYLRELLLDLMLCRQALTDASKKISRFIQFARENPDRTVADLERFAFEYSDPPFNTALLQKRLDQLRRLPPNQSTPELPPEYIQA